MATTADFRNGLCIEMNNDIWQIVEFQHVKPGKGNAFVRTRLKSMYTGKVLEHTFPSGHTIITARVERRPFQFLYKDETGYNFMNTETYEQVAVQEQVVSNPGLLKEGQTVEIIFHSEKEEVLGCELPQYVDMLITYAENSVKGDTATNAYKNATVETGAIVKVPMFITEGERIRVNTLTNEYVERVK